MRSISLAELGADFGVNFERSAYRLELLDYYDSQLYRDSLAGRPVNRTRWDKLIQDSKAAGKIMQRVHVVPAELTDYLRHELEFYRGSVLAGEDIRILTRADARDLDIGDKDFWLFDSKTVAIMEYDSAGLCTAVHIDTEPEFVARCNRWRDVALARAISLEDWQKERERAA